MRTRSPLQCFLLISIAVWSLSARPSLSETANPAAAQPVGAKHFLWRVTNAPQPVYLLGSYHALRGSDYPLGHEIDQAIGQCKRFVFEFDMKHSEEGNYSKKMRDQSHYPAGITLKQKVRSETYAYAQKIAKTRASTYNDMKPWAIAFFMMSHPYYYNVYSYWGVEGYVMRKAGASAEFGGLETADEHVRVLSDMRDIEGEVFLLQAFVYADANAANFGKEITAYKRGDSQALAAFDAQRDREAPFITWRIIDHRNAQWIPRIEQEMKSGKSTMIVVGARHLCGAHNVISMLQAKGYSLEQL